MITLIRTMELLGDEGKHRWRYPAGMNKENKKIMRRNAIHIMANRVSSKDDNFSDVTTYIKRAMLRGIPPGIQRRHLYLNYTFDARESILNTIEETTEEAQTQRAIDHRAIDQHSREQRTEDRHRTQQRTSARTRPSVRGNKRRSRKN